HVLEILDPRDGSLIASTVVEPGGVVKGFLDRSHLFGVREATDGSIELVVWRVTLNAPAR
ncbi:MAG: hypothetical protein ACRELV_11695, partial [Longimicrobiales bacterium]